MQRHQARYASPVEMWVPALLDRLQDSNVTPQGWLPAWALPLLNSTKDAAVTIKKLLAYKYGSSTVKRGHKSCRGGLRNHFQGLLSYAVIMAAPFYRFALFVAALLLWVQPRLEYQKEAVQNESLGQAAWRKVPKIRKGILAFVVSAMVEWRRILINLNTPQQTKQPGEPNDKAKDASDNRRKTFAFAPYSWGFVGRYLLRVGVALIVGSVLLTNLDPGLLTLKSMFSADPLGEKSFVEKLMVIGLIVTATYLATMLYVAVEFWRAKRFTAAPQDCANPGAVSSARGTPQGPVPEPLLNCHLCEETIAFTSFPQHLRAHADVVIQEMQGRTMSQESALRREVTSLFDDVRKELGLESRS